MSEPKTDAAEERRKEEEIAEHEFRTLGHRIVWSENGNCNVPGMPSKSGEELDRQLARQKKYSELY